MRISKLLLMACVISALAVSGCGKSAPPDPRSAVIAMFGAMEKDDQAALAHLLDLAELMRSTNDYSLQTNKPRLFTNPKQILDDMTGNGETKRRWFSMQRIVSTSEVTGESATVDVTFVDKTTSIGYLTKFGLHIVNRKWKIYSFKTIDAPPEG